MRKLFFALAFMLVGSFAYANDCDDNKLDYENNYEIITDFEFSVDAYFFTKCKVIHNVVDAEGNLLLTVTYTATISSGTCQAYSDSKIDDTLGTYNELFG